MQAIPTLHDLFSPRGLLIRAFWIAAAFLLCHVAGLRAFTSFLCGMMPMAGMAAQAFALLGLVYVILFMAFTLVVPVLVIAAALIRLADHCLGEANKAEGPK
jgi:hypothetical protein